jgi:hypothetical protein
MMCDYIPNCVEGWILDNLHYFNCLFDEDLEEWRKEQLNNIKIDWEEIDESRKRGVSRALSLLLQLGPLLHGSYGALRTTTTL